MHSSEQLLRMVDELADGEMPVIVEGRKDQQALEALGVDTERIITCTKPSFKIIELLQMRNCREVAILTDLDRQGKKLYRRLHSECIRFGIKTNNRLRLFLLQETPLQHIEGLDTYLSHQLSFLPEGKSGSAAAHKRPAALHNMLADTHWQVAYG